MRYFLAMAFSLVSATPALAQSVVAQSAAPRGNPADWFVATSDYPPAAFAQKREGTVAVSYLVTVAGRAEECRVTSSSGSPDLDEATCRLMQSRARYRPAMDIKGNAIASMRTQRVTWKLPDYLDPPAQAAAPAAGPNELPIQVRRDLIAQEIRTAVAAAQPKATLQAVDRYLALGEGYTPEIAMITVRASLAADLPSRAKGALESYLKGVTNTDPFYAEAIALYPKVQQAVAAREARRKQRKIDADILMASLHTVPSKEFYIYDGFTHPLLPLSPALLRIDAFLKKYPNDQYGLAARAEVLARLKRLPEARTAYIRAIQASDGNYAYVYVSRASIMGFQTDAARLDDIERALTIKPDVYGDSMPDVEKVPGGWERLEKVYTIAIANEPDKTGNYFRRWSLYTQWKKYDRAIPDITKLIELEPTRTFYRAYRCNTYANIPSKLNEAIADCTAAIQQGMNTSYDYAARGMVFLRARRFKEALADYDTALANVKSDSSHKPRMLLGRGIAKTGLGDIAGGNADAEEAHAMFAKSPDIGNPRQQFLDAGIIK